MKTILLLIALVGTASAQQSLPFVHSVDRKTNVQHIAASGVIAAHSVTAIAEIAYVGVIDNGQFKPFDQPALRVVSVTTNLADTAVAAKPIVPNPHLRSAKPTEPEKQGVLYDPPSVPSSVNTNSVQWKRAHHLPPFK